MKRVLILCVGMLMMLSSPQGATAQPSSKDIIARFRKVINAEKTINKTSTMLIDGCGELYTYTLHKGRLQGTSQYFTVRDQIQGTDRYREDLEMKIGIVPLKITAAMNKDKGWVQLNEGEPTILDKKSLVWAKERDFLFIEVVFGHENFSGWKLSPPQSTVVRGKDAWVIVAKTKGRNPLTLSFAKKSGFLLRMQMKGTDLDLTPSAAGKLRPLQRDVYLLNWKKFHGAYYPGEEQVFRDGVLFMVRQNKNITFTPRIDAKLFALPKKKKP